MIRFMPLLRCTNNRTKSKLAFLYAFFALPWCTHGIALARHKLVDYQGSIILQRKQTNGWAAPVPVRRRGFAMSSQDRIEVKIGSEALVRCASSGNRLWTVEPGGPFPVSRGCGSETILRLAPRWKGSLAEAIQASHT